MISVSLGQLKVPLARRALPGLHIPIVLCTGLFTARPWVGTHTWCLCLTGGSTKAMNSLRREAGVGLVPVVLGVKACL